MPSKKHKTKRPELAQSPIIDELPLACSDETAARAFLERQRWGDTPCCPHCGDTAVYRMSGESAQRRGLLRCRGCKEQFTVRVGTIFGDSPIPLHKWCRAFWEMAAAKNGISALEFSRKIQVTPKSALFMLHRCRHAMADDPATPPKLTGTVEADETYIGGKPRHKGTLEHPINKRGRGTNKQPVAAVVQRGGDVRATPISGVSAENLRAVLEANVDKSARISTDEWAAYPKATQGYAEHLVVKHAAKQYVSGEATTNSAESFFARCKRSLNGTYHAVSRGHLHRYVSQWQFSWNTRGMNDGQRVVELIRRTGGKRLVYRDGQSAA